MASAQSFLVNHNPHLGVQLLDSFIDPHIFNHIMCQNMSKLISDATEIIIDARYDLRPDMLSYENYGTNFWYPAILVANRLGSILQFKASYMNNRCLIPSQAVIQELISLQNSKLKNE